MKTAGYSCPLMLNVEVFKMAHKNPYQKEPTQPSFATSRNASPSSSAQCWGRVLRDDVNGCGSVGDQVSISFSFYERYDLLFQGNSIARSSETIGRTRRSGTELGVKGSNPQTNGLTEIRNEIKKNLEKMKEENTRVCSSPLGSVSNLDAAFNRCRSQLLFPCL